MVLSLKCIRRSTVTYPLTGFCVPLLPKPLIQERLKLSGAWWKIDNADKMLALRVTQANGNWEKYWNTYEAGESPCSESIDRKPGSTTLARA